MRPASPHISADDTAALTCRGIAGIETGVDEDVFKEVFLEFVLRTFGAVEVLGVDGERLVLGVEYLRFLEEDLVAGLRPRSSFGGESSERSMSRLASDMISTRCVSFGALPGDMLSRTEAGAGTCIVSTVLPSRGGPSGWDPRASRGWDSGCATIGISEWTWSELGMPPPSSEQVWETSRVADILEFLGE